MTESTVICDQLFEKKCQVYNDIISFDSSKQFVLSKMGVRDYANIFIFYEMGLPPFFLTSNFATFRKGTSVRKGMPYL